MTTRLQQRIAETPLSLSCRADAELDPATDFLRRWERSGAAERAPAILTPARARRGTAVREMPG